MSEENLEEWDTAFLEQVEQVIQAKERSFSSSTTNLSQLPMLPPNSLNNNTFISYSPPRELSQRTTTVDYSNSVDRSSSGIVANSTASSDNAKDLEIKRLTRELGRISKQLTELEHECSELKKGKNVKEELIKLATSKNDEKVANIHNLKCTNLNYGVPPADHHGVPQQFQNANVPDILACPQINAASSSCKAIGVQVDLTSHHDLPEKLRFIWCSPRDQILGKSLISKLFVDCSAEFHVLFGCMSLNTPSKMMDSLAVKNSDVALQFRAQSYPSSEAEKISHFYSLLTKLFVDCSAEFHVLFGCMSLNTPSKMMDSLAVKNSDVALQFRAQSYPSSEAEKISHFYSLLTKISNGMIQLEALLEPLLDLCHVDNVMVVSKSLRILNVFLKHIFSLEREVEERVNVMVEGILSRNNIGDHRGSYTAKNRPFNVSGNEAHSAGYIPFGIRFSGAETLCKNRLWCPDRAMSLSCINWVFLFELIHQTTVRFTDESVRSEAISIMNMIVMHSHSYMDREKFGQNPVFESISQLLKKDAGLRVQSEAVCLLYLLLNCPKIFVTFCSGCKEVENAGTADDSHGNPSPSKEFSMILDGLAECIGGCGNSVEEFKLRRNAIIVIAFMVSSGNSGVEILASQKLCGKANFLMLILQELVSETDTEAAAARTEPADVFRARTLLIREILILLNRLVSNHAYSSGILRVLTNSRDMASLTIDVATRLSRKVIRCEQSDSISRQMRESEVVDLGRIFRKRVFTYLGDNVS